MNLWNLFRKKPASQPEDEPEKDGSSPDLGIYSGMRVEVISLDDRLLFVAKLQGLRGNQAELYQYSESALPPDTEPVRVMIRGYSDYEKKAVYMVGTISPMPKEIWQVSDLIVSRIGNDRAFFRLDTNVSATVAKVGGVGTSLQSCKMVNISIGGACISVNHKYHEHDKLLLNVRLLADREPSVMLCQILRINPKEHGIYEYGCRFLALSEADKERITQDIFEVQRQKRIGKA